MFFQYREAFLKANPGFKWYKLPAPTLRPISNRLKLLPDLISHQDSITPGKLAGRFLSHSFVWVFIRDRNSYFTSLKRVPILVLKLVLTCSEIVPIWIFLHRIEWSQTHQSSRRKKNCTFSCKPFNFSSNKKPLQIILGPNILSLQALFVTHVLKPLWNPWVHWAMHSKKKYWYIV